ncbi:MAG: C4-dicarboxylate ABC transporter permease [Paracoccaceae bacterium]|nr:C4-dicarboxylate ABC transporter permease [Paracoccaceae bacterium]
MDGVVWFFQNLFSAFYNIFYAVTHPGLWLDWSNNEAMMRFVYYGGSTELFFAFLLIFFIVTAIGMWRNNFMWGCVRVLEGISNGVGRFFAWAGLLMVLQQILIVFLQRIFRVAEISISPFGIAFTKDLSWYGEELKLYNAAIVCLCATYTFVQGGHVRVDLVYAAVKFRTKKVIDMFGSLFFILPMATVIWMYAWYFMWRHLITPKVSASDSLELLLRKSRVVRWNVETIGFSPNGFNGYFLFKVLLIAFTALLFLQAVSFFYRSFLEWKEGEESENKYLDKDTLGEGEEAYEGTH